MFWETWFVVCVNMENFDFKKTLIVNKLNNILVEDFGK